MEQLPRQQYTTEFREQAVQLVLAQQLTIPEAARRLTMSGRTLERWVCRARQGQLATLGESRRPVTDLEAELSRLKRDLAEARTERDILKKPPHPVRRRSGPVRAHEDAAPPVSVASVVSGAGGVPKRRLCLAASAVVETRAGECPVGSGNSGGACAHPEDVWTGATPSGITGRRLPRRDWADQAAAEEAGSALHTGTRSPRIRRITCQWRRISWRKRSPRRARMRPGSPISPMFLQGKAGCM